VYVYTYIHTYIIYTYVFLNVKSGDGYVVKQKHVVFLDYYNKEFCRDWLFYGYV